MGIENLRDMKYKSQTIYPHGASHKFMGITHKATLPTSCKDTSSSTIKEAKLQNPIQVASYIKIKNQRMCTSKNSIISHIKKKNISSELS